MKKIYKSSEIDKLRYISTNLLDAFCVACSMEDNPVATDIGKCLEGILKYSLSFRSVEIPNTELLTKEQIENE